jgi:hypothetical protein
MICNGLSMLKGPAVLELPGFLGRGEPFALLAGRRRDEVAQKIAEPRPKNLLTFPAHSPC